VLSRNISKVGRFASNEFRRSTDLSDYDLIVNLRKQIRPKSENDEQDLKLFLKSDNKSRCATEEKTETANVEIYCNRNYLEELLERENAKKKQRNGNIMLEDYLQLVTNEQLRFNFLLKILTKAISEHKMYSIYGTLPPLKTSLDNRGWVEKKAIRRIKDVSSTADLYEGIYVWRHTAISCTNLKK